MLYNVPGRTVADLKPATVARLAKHPRIFGIKEATGELDRVETIRGLCGPEFRLYSGDDATAREFMRLGGHGVVSVTANVAPAAMAQMCQAALAGDACSGGRDRRSAGGPAPGPVHRIESDSGQVGAGADGADPGWHPPAADAAVRRGAADGSKRRCAARGYCNDERDGSSWVSGWRRPAWLPRSRSAGVRFGATTILCDRRRNTRQRSPFRRSRCRGPRPARSGGRG